MCFSYAMEWLELVLFEINSKKQVPLVRAFFKCSSEYNIIPESHYEFNLVIESHRQYSTIEWK